MNDDGSCGCFFNYRWHTNEAPYRCRSKLHLQLTYLLLVSFFSVIVVAMDEEERRMGMVQSKSITNRTKLVLDQLHFEADELAYGL